MKSVEATGKTRKEAIQKALDQLGLELHEVKVEILDEGSKGLFGIGARDVRVRLTAENAPEGRGAEAAALLQEVIKRMGIEATVTAAPGSEGETRVNVTTPDSALLIGRKGRNLEAMQYLLNRMVTPSEDAEESERIIVDVEGYLERRKAGLEEMAHRMAQKAKELGRNIRLKPLSPPERRIIHLALENDPDVRTFSLGNSSERSVVIAPKNESQPSPEPSRRPRGGGRRPQRRGSRPGGGQGRQSRPAGPRGNGGAGAGARESS